VDVAGKRCLDVNPLPIQPQGNNARTQDIESGGGGGGGGAMPNHNNYAGPIGRTENPLATLARSGGGSSGGAGGGGGGAGGEQLPPDRVGLHSQRNPCATSPAALLRLRSVEMRAQRGLHSQSGGRRGRSRSSFLDGGGGADADDAEEEEAPPSPLERRRARSSSTGALGKRPVPRWRSSPQHEAVQMEALSTAVAREMDARAAAGGANRGTATSAGGGGGGAAAAAAAAGSAAAMSTSVSAAVAGLHFAVVEDDDEDYDDGENEGEDRAGKQAAGSATSRSSLDELEEHAPTAAAFVRGDTAADIIADAESLDADVTLADRGQTPADARGQGQDAPAKMLLKAVRHKRIEQVGFETGAEALQGRGERMLPHQVQTPPPEPLPQPQPEPQEQPQDVEQEAAAAEAEAETGA